MATGDGIDTAMSVARTIKLIDEDKQTWVAELDETDEGNPQIKWKDASAEKAP